MSREVPTHVAAHPAVSVVDCAPDSAAAEAGGLWPPMAFPSCFRHFLLFIFIFIFGNCCFILGKAESVVSLRIRGTIMAAEEGRRWRQGGKRVAFTSRAPPVEGSPCEPTLRLSRTATSACSFEPNNSNSATTQ
jgi:hypothetical protein